MVNTSYYGIRIGNRIQASFRVVLGLFSITVSDRYRRFQGHDIIQRQITRQWHNIELYSQ